MVEEAEPDWIVKAETALAAAIAMPPGAERIAALRAAGKLRQEAMNRQIKADPNFLRLRYRKTAPPF